MSARSPTQKRALEVHAGHGGPRAGPTFAYPGDAVGQDAEGRGGQRRAPRRDALPGEKDEEAGPALVVRGRDIDVVVPVYLEIDEAGSDQVEFGRVLARGDFDDQAAAEPDLVILEDPVGCDEAPRADAVDQFSRSRNSRRRILPDALFGMASTSSSRRICL